MAPVRAVRQGVRRAAAVDAEGSPSAPLVPRGPGGRVASWDAVAAAARRCQACPLWEPATQTVFGEGPAGAPFMLVGEQPGDREDLAGRPFVGPAGGLLDRALAEAGIDREQVYVTNAVKHFSFVERGNKRIHQKPKGREVKACKGWLAAEIELVAPRLVVCLGATAAQALLGPAFRLTQSRGQVQPGVDGGPSYLATYHPSALLRAPDEATRHALYADLVADLRAAARHVAVRR
jgi:uracil-DNA glycosylase family protein